MKAPGGGLTGHSSANTFRNRLKSNQREKEKRSELEKYLAEKFHDTLKITIDDLGKRFVDFKAESEKTQKAIVEQKGKLRPNPLVRALFDMGGEPSVAYLLRRGDAQTPGEPAQPGALQSFELGSFPTR